MKAREPRHKVMIKGRMRVGTAWGDVCILNVSSRGLLIQASSPQPCGSYVEVRRGHHVIVARVVWTSDLRFGVKTQEPVAVEEIIRAPDQPAGSAPATTNAAPAERRASPRREAQHDKSRTVARAMEFGFIAFLGTSAAFVLFDFAQRALANPLAQVSSALQQR